jgi:hypothetical protein
MTYSIRACPLVCIAPFRGFELGANSLTGTIPEGISALTALQWVPMFS